MMQPNPTRFKDSRAAVAGVLRHPAASASLSSGHRLSLVASALGIIAAAVLLKPLAASNTVLADMDCVVEPSSVIELGSPVPGLISRVHNDRTDYVSAGTLLAELESEVELTTYAIAKTVALQTTALQLREVTAAFGERTRRRNATLVHTSAISEQSMDQVETETAIATLQLQQERENQQLAQLEMARARALLERRRIVSPIDGTILRRYKSAGEYVDNDAVFRLAQLDPLYVEVIVPVEHLGEIQAGMQAGVQLLAPGFEARLLEASVRRVDAVADAASGTYGVRLVLDNPDFSIPSGVRCEVDFFGS